MNGQERLQFQPIAGTHDILPEEFENCEDIKTRLKTHFISYGYRGIEVPVLDYTALYLKKAGEEVVSKMYAFEDLGNNKICLRPELTACVVRAYINNLQSVKKPIKLFYIGPAFRYDRPQKGRYRQFTHAGLELIGPNTAMSEAEIIYLACNGLNKMGLKNYQTKISHIGVISNLLDSLGLNERLKNLFISSLEDLGKEDKGFPYLQEKLSAIGEKGAQIDNVVAFLFELRQIKGIYPEVFDQIEGLIKKYHLQIPTALEGLKKTANILSFYDLDPKQVEINFGFGRGLQYYTGLIFELEYKGLGAQSQICGGGRYDNLIEILGGLPCPALGFAYGLERVQLALEIENLLSQPKPSNLTIFIIPYNESVYDYSISILTRLREQGINAGIDLMGKGIRKNLDDVNQDKIPFAMVIGPDEKEAQLLNLRNMAESKEIKIPLNEFDKVMCICKSLK